MADLSIFVDPTSGADTNGGSSLGSADASGAGAVTDGTATIDLSADTPDLSSVVAGDLIRVAGESAGIGGTDIFEITSVDDGADTVAVTPTPASSASGLAWAIGGALATGQKAIDIGRSQTSGQQRIRLMATAAETTGVVNIDQQEGVVGSQIFIEGADGSGDRLATGLYYELQSTGSPTNLMSWAGGAFYVWRHIDFNGASDDVSGIMLNMAGSSGGNNNSFEHCRMRNGANNGASMRGGPIAYLDCDIFGFTIGLVGQLTASSRWVNGSVRSSRVHDNSSHGVSLTDTAFTVENNELYGNGGSGLVINLDAPGGSISGNTIALNGVDGVVFTDDLAVQGFYNNSMVQNVQYGLRGGSNQPPQECDYNHYFDNRNGLGGEHTDIVSNANINDGTIGQNNQEGDPLFASVVDGSEDFTPGAGSPLIGNGLLGVTIGARAGAAGAGATLGMF